jgi:hypothetical protein
MSSRVLQLSVRPLNDRGFLAVDALIGLLVVALGLIAAIEAESHVQQITRAALDLRLATAEAEYRLDTEWPKLRRPGAVGGRRADRLASWTLRAWPLRALPNTELAVCHVEADVTMEGSRRRTRITTERLCTVGGQS